MAKTTNILDLNNRLAKVEKKNVAQNSYTSLKNKPKINGVTLTGNKSLADIGAAAAADLTTLAGDVGDVTQLNTTDKSSCVVAINEVNGNFNNLKYHKIAESASTGTYAQKLQSLASAYNALSIEQKRSALLSMNSVDIYHSVNCSGNWFSVWVDSSSVYLTRYGIDGSAYVENGGTVTDNSSVENVNVFSLWVCEP